MTTRPSGRDILVIGAGVTGLTTALVLLERGYQVRLVSKERPAHTNSRVATAIWHIFLVEFNLVVEKWGQETVRKLNLLAQDPASGVSIVRGVERLRNRNQRVMPAWAELVNHFRWLDREEIPAGVSDAYEVEVPIADMSIYLPWLERQVQDSGGTIQIRAVSSLEEEFLSAGVVVNCSGLGARELVQDPTVYAVKGQISYYTKLPDITDYIGDDDHPQGMTYFIPRINDIVVGGTAEANVEDMSVDTDVARRMFERCVEMNPSLAAAHFLRSVAGIRPCRVAGIRLEAEVVGTSLLVHNYAHGGSGFSLSWGCANEVANLVDRFYTTVSSAQDPVGRIPPSGA